MVKNVATENPLARWNWLSITRALSCVHPQSNTSNWQLKNQEVIKKDKVQEFMDHINHQNPHIKFTNDPEKDVELPFLDTLVKRQPDGSLQVSVYKKPTHKESQTNI